MTAIAHDRLSTSEGTTTVRGASIAWSRAGTGPLAVYAHALSHDRDSLAGAGGLLDLAPLARTHTVVRYDARGHGLSGGNPRPEEYPSGELGRDLLALLAVWSPAEPVSGIGTSLGTTTLLHAATRQPEAFARLVLTAPPTMGERRGAQAEIYERLARAVEADGLDSMIGMLKAAATPPILADAPPLEPRISERLLPAVLRGVGSSDVPDREAIAALRMPVLILSWADDPGHPVASGEYLHGLIPGSEFAVAHSRAEVERWPETIAGFLEREA